MPQGLWLNWTENSCGLHGVRLARKKTIEDHCLFYPPDENLSGVDLNDVFRFVLFCFSFCFGFGGPGGGFGGPGGGFLGI